MKEAVLRGKQAVVSEIKDRIERADSIILMDYRGLNVAEVTQLRENFRKNNVDYKVYKNTLMARAFNELGYEEFTQFLEGPNGIAFSYEDVF